MSNVTFEDRPYTPDPETTEALALRKPETPVTLSELAAMKGEAVEIIEARVLVLETLRKASIRATSPEDWLLFKSPEEQGGQVVGYLQDCGCDRVRDLYGIEIFGISKPEKVVANEPGVFHYLITGSGRCKLTRQVVEEMEGGRSSTDDFCRGKTGAELELAVRKAARANLDGNITRELAGMKSVPLDDIKRAWEGTPKLVDHCRKGRGYGTRDERLGGGARPDEGIDPPPCPACKKAMVLRKGSKGFFYSCQDYKDHGTQARTIDLDKWIAEQKTKTAQSPATPASTTSNQPSGRQPQNRQQKVEPLDADDIFGRSPGQEG